MTKPPPIDIRFEIRIAPETNGADLEARVREWQEHSDRLAALVHPTQTVPHDPWQTAAAGLH